MCSTMPFENIRREAKSGERLPTLVTVIDDSEVESSKGGVRLFNLEESNGRIQRMDAIAGHPVFARSSIARISPAPVALPRPSTRGRDLAAQREVADVPR
ncbi:hypothetical protein KM043_006350 [Ampulex compressa]|nr:hypothetical protein KM043_006350 [Ampulex compressa]